MNKTTGSVKAGEDMEVKVCVLDGFVGSLSVIEQSRLSHGSSACGAIAFMPWPAQSPCQSEPHCISKLKHAFAFFSFAFSLYHSCPLLSFSPMCSILFLLWLNPCLCPCRRHPCPSPCLLLSFAKALGCVMVSSFTLVACQVHLRP